jgi:hypothetical protein
MYVITNHNEGNFVILGPMRWKSRYFSEILSDELDTEIVITQADESRVPFEPVPGVKIRKCNETYEDINSKIHSHDGPFWTYHSDTEEYQATANWVKKDKPIVIVKSELKAIAASERWKKESLGVDVTIQGQTVWCDTSRGNRDVFLQKYTLMGENDVIGWKFPGDTWLTLTKSELGLIVSTGATYIQGCFDWEANLAATIDACTTLEELDAIEIVPQTNSEVPEDNDNNNGSGIEE